MRLGKKERRAQAECDKLHAKRVERAKAVSDDKIHTSSSLLVSRCGMVMRGRPNSFIEDHPGTPRKYFGRWGQV